jgi:hypothetical protein
MYKKSPFNARRASSKFSKRRDRGDRSEFQNFGEPHDLNDIDAALNSRRHRPLCGTQFQRARCSIFLRFRREPVSFVELLHRLCEARPIDGRNRQP